MLKYLLIEDQSSTSDVFVIDQASIPLQAFGLNSVNKADMAS